VEGEKEVQTQIQEQQLQVDTIAEETGAFRFHGIIKNSDDTGSKVYDV
jgi:hypothetical protein